ncbi:response regulator transcription factor [Bacillus sp. V3B]|uniref:response regulator transcription factor n=1 Tax=Bacillus sp. V3B TaxID=2804915 RepID=UPI00210B1736|nr:response regulator transcription factor [Bacillus sp. V3B]MCQ6274816.1 response regulator transcription factor [Bacillus sp. V3B]
MIRIVIAEDQEMLLGVIGSLLNLEDDMEVVGQARNGEEALTLVHQLQPDVCIMDIEMPEMNGLEAADALMPAGYKVIILTTFARTGYFERARKAGVRGYLLKDSPSEELACSIRSIIDGKQMYSPELMDNDSSDNEQEIVEWLTDGQMTNEISNQPSNTMGTVRNYFSTIMDKMKLPAG